MADLDEMRQQLDLLSDEELTSILRGHDEEKWRPEAFEIIGSILRERGVSQGEDSKCEEDALDETAGLDLVTAAHYADHADAETDRRALEAKGILAWIYREPVPQTGDMSGAVQLRVRADDLAAALAILESEPVPSSDLPAEIAEPPCPKCGSREVTEGAEIVEDLADSAGLSPKQVWFYHCASCGHKWSES